MTEKEFLSEIYRIRELILFEAFGANEKLIPKYIETVVNRMGEKPFDRFFNGEATLREFKIIMKTKIKRGDFGNDFGAVTKNLQYLKSVPAILGTLEREYKKNPDKFSGLDKFLFGDEGSSDKPLEGINQKVLYGDFCKTCKNPKDVMSKLDEVVKARQKMIDLEDEKEKILKKTTDPVEAEKMLKKLYGDTYGLFNFFTKGHVRRGQDILDKYNLRGYGTTVMGKNVVQLQLIKPLKITFTDDLGSTKTIVDKKAGELFRTEYHDRDDILIYKTKKQEYRIDIKMDSEPVEGRTYNTKVLRVLPALGKTLQVDEVNLNIQFKVIKMGTSKEVDQFMATHIPK